MFKGGGEEGEERLQIPGSKVGERNACSGESGGKPGGTWLGALRAGWLPQGPSGWCAALPPPASGFPSLMKCR